MTKNHSLLHIAILFALLFTGCSDDEPTPVKGNSLISGFREIYGFQAEKVGSESYEAKNLIIPVSGVSSYRDGVYDYTISASLYPRLPLPEGILYTAENNPAWYNLHIKRYGDDSYSGKPLKDVYEPHPYGIVKIDMTVVYDVIGDNEFITGRQFKTNADYNGHYKEGDNCNSLFRIRYRSYYDYIKNGYSWKGLNQDSPWYEMDLDEFNARGGAKLIDMTKFYLIAKERPTNPMYNSPWKMGTYRVFKTDIYFDNGKKNRTTKEMKIFSRF